MGSLIIQKRDSQTGEALPGAEFRVTTAAGCEVGLDGVIGTSTLTQNGIFTTDAQGEIRISNLVPGAYVITEIKAPDGYVIDSPSTNVVIGTNGDTQTVVIKDTKKGNLIVEKYDSVTRQPLKGAQFKVTAASGEFVADNEGMTGTNGLYTTDINGQIILSITPTSLTHDSVSGPGQRPSKPLEQGRQKFVQKRRKEAAAQRRKKRCELEHTAPTRQRDAGTVQSRHTPALPAQNGKQPARNTVQESVSNGRHLIKERRSGANAVGRGSRQAVKGSESAKKALQTGGRSTQAMRQAARAAVQARQRAVQAAGAAKRTTAAVGRPAAKAAASALRGAVSAIRTALVPLAVGGGAVIAVVLVLCLAGALLASPLGIFFSGGDSDGLTISAAVREIDLEYDARVEELKTGVTYDEVSLSGSRAPWVEILAVYAVKTATDLTDGQEVVTMTDGKKALMKQIFWDMNELSSFTSTVLGEEDDEEDTTTLYITVTAKTAGEMADIYGFNDDQRRQLNELLSDEYREMWDGVL